MREMSPMVRTGGWHTSRKRSGVTPVKSPMWEAWLHSAYSSVKRRSSKLGSARRVAVANVLH